MNTIVTITIDGKQINAEEGSMLLWAALENDIYIPNLCAMKEKARPSASCRLCFVEVEGMCQPVTSCTQPVTEGMVVRTRSPQVDRLVQTAFELLLSDHLLGCSKCPKNKSCKLQRIAKERKLKLTPKRLEMLEKDYPVDDSTDVFVLDRNRCVLCGRCVWVDHHAALVGAIGFSMRGIKRKVSTFGDKLLVDSTCTQCGECVKVCPVGALSFKKNLEVSIK
ncbi:2Fe-2S iron-sulfur cluster-binding protein [Candidatus Contubernalis alkaliaceticus]|uniref:2Fe-2S iron-sulfur cluster-binding protein n=1 Tax=Candidatus Contubernalis alkaliaceticus TaxID=338645 RepID=UPI001F4C2AC2|nr:2Fe-2S iron-sulfur cluster-binding protein [Candidatus Contubernalis alkalaceticus]UNC91804.1 (2Fe-2S)-binding protein [Candidatus Contubernalis alkalaceticus]